MLAASAPVVGFNYSRRQLFTNAAIAASRVASKPWVGVRSSSCPKVSVHIQGVRTGAACTFMMRPDNGRRPRARRSRRHSTRQMPLRISGISLVHIQNYDNGHTFY